MIDIGTALQAITWALDHVGDDAATVAFLEEWREGALEDWPEYLAWLKTQPSE